MSTIFTIVLAVLFLSTATLQRCLRSVSTKELRRWARVNKDKKAAAIYKLAAFGGSAELFLWLVGAFSAAGLVLLAFSADWWWGLLAVLAVLWVSSQANATRPVNTWMVGWAALAAPLFSTLTSLLQPVLAHVSRKQRPNHTLLYEKEDFTEFIKAQARQPDNRISQIDLKTAHYALSFSDKTVREVMTPRQKVKWIAANEPIGPMVMDELHKTGQTRFPVAKELTKGGSPEVVGALYLQDLLDHLEDKGRIRDIMLSGANFINESQNLPAALDGFLKSGRHLLIVVNNFEEIAGVLTLEDLFEQILGQKISDEFDRYGDIHSVATRDTKRADDKEA